jgi:hypothetical protein
MKDMAAFERPFEPWIFWPPLGHPSGFGVGWGVLALREVDFVRRLAVENGSFA